MTIFLITLILISVFTLAAVFVVNQPQFGSIPDNRRKKDFQLSDHFNGKKFHNPGGITVDMNFFKALALIPEWISQKGEKTPDNPLPVVHLNKEHFESDFEDDYRITWFGHSAVLVEIGQMKVFFDPMLGPNPSPLSGKNRRYSKALPADISELPQLDAVVITHDHFDHLDYKTILELDQKTGHYIVPLGVGVHLVKWGVQEHRITELDWWQKKKLGTLNFTATPAQHFSGRRLRHRDSSLWCSFVIDSGEKRLFFSGDSGYSESFKTIGEKFGPFDLCMLECGQYNERWKEIHMMPEETWQTFLDLKGNYLLPIHWGAFSLSLHSWYEPVTRLIKAAQSEQDKVLTPKIGQPFSLNTEIPLERWWKKELM